MKARAALKMLAAEALISPGVKHLERHGHDA
jgi:hypothetical protein